jgi:hypothetical protein
MGNFENSQKVIDADKMNKEIQNPLSSITDVCIVKKELTKPDYYQEGD